uniref:Uncharacterized protein n=1 Tax=Arundo donax TaxID=35708 RepID=A0A0A8ZRX1_ARUDO
MFFYTIIRLLNPTLLFFIVSSRALLLQLSIRNKEEKIEDGRNETNPKKLS